MHNVQPHTAYISKKATFLPHTPPPASILLFRISLSLSLTLHMIIFSTNTHTHTHTHKNPPLTLSGLTSFTEKNVLLSPATCSQSSTRSNLVWITLINHHFTLIFLRILVRLNLFRSCFYSYSFVSIDLRYLLSKQSVTTRNFSLLICVICE